LFPGKPKKLPAETVSEDYALEYGADRVEIQKDAISAGENFLMSTICWPPAARRRRPARLVEKLAARWRGSVLSSSWVPARPREARRLRRFRPAAYDKMSAAPRRPGCGRWPRST
jgi:hypothetical protein